MKHGPAILFGRLKFEQLGMRLQQPFNGCEIAFANSRYDFPDYLNVHSVKGRTDTAPSAAARPQPIREWHWHIPASQSRSAAQCGSRPVYRSRLGGGGRGHVLSLRRALLSRAAASSLIR